MVAGLMDQEDVDFYKIYKKTKEHSDVDKKRFTLLDKKRQSGKKTVYSGMYGIGKDKLSRELKCSVSEAKNLLDAYWKVNWAIRKAADDFEKKMVNGSPIALRILKCMPSWSATGCCQKASAQATKLRSSPITDLNGTLPISEFSRLEQLMYPFIPL